MGKLKQSLIDTDQEDQTDPRDVFSPPDDSQPSVADWALHDLWSASNRIVEVKHDLTLGDLEELYSAINRLQSVADHLNKPF